MLDYHIHLERGPYTWDWVKQFLRQAEAKGIKEIGIVEHLYLFREARDLLFFNKHVQERQTKSLEAFFSFVNDLKKIGLPVKLGLEVDYSPIFSTKIADFVSQLPVDYLIGSVHYLDDWAFDLDANWGERNLQEVYEKYYETLTEAATTGIFDIIGHPGNIAYFGYHLDSEAEASLEEKFLNDVKKLPICLEINAGGLYKAAQDTFPRQQLFEKIHDLNIPVTLASDAHDPALAGYGLRDQVIPALKKAGFTTVYGFSKRKRMACKI